MRGYYSEPPPGSKLRHHASQYRVGVVLIRAHSETPGGPITNCYLSLAANCFSVAVSELAETGSLE
jgi:hypothetical protein